jgi:hypothetical protein
VPPYWPVRSKGSWGVVVLLSTGCRSRDEIPEISGNIFHYPGAIRDRRTILPQVFEVCQSRFFGMDATTRRCVISQPLSDALGSPRTHREVLGHLAFVIVAPGWLYGCLLRLNVSICIATSSLR